MGRGGCRFWGLFGMGFLSSCLFVFYFNNVQPCLLFVAVSVTLFFLLVVIILIFVFRSRLEGGDYETEEATGAEFADDADTAVVYNQTGLPNMTTKYEFFM